MYGQKVRSRLELAVDSATGSDFTCPRCRYTLKAQSEPLGTLWKCDACKGIAIGLGLLRRMFTEESTQLLWANAVDGNGNTVCDCPACNKPMQEVAAASALRVDVCCRCQFVWLDAGEIERFTKRSGLAKVPQLPEAAQEILGQAIIQQVAYKAHTENAAHSLRNAVLLPYKYGSPIDYLVRVVWGLWMRGY